MQGSYFKCYPRLKVVTTPVLEILITVSISSINKITHKEGLKKKTISKQTQKSLKVPCLGSELMPTKELSINISDTLLRMNQKIMMIYFQFYNGILKSTDIFLLQIYIHGCIYMHF